VSQRKRIVLRTDEGGLLELVNISGEVWLRIEPPPDGLVIDSVNFRGRMRVRLHAFATQVVKATRPRVTGRKP
jgi:hypothetical protein